MDMMEQALALGKMPHVIIATPGRLMDHLQNTKGFTLKKSLKYLVMDEADRILNMDFEKEVNQILANIPRAGRKNMLFSATMTKKVAKLQRASLTGKLEFALMPTYLVLSERYDTLTITSCFLQTLSKSRYLQSTRLWTSCISIISSFR